MQFLDYLILAVIFALAFFAIRYSVKHKNKCCGNCSGCSGCCHNCTGCKVKQNNAEKPYSNTHKT